MHDVLVSYAANPGCISTSRRKRLLRSSPIASVASTGKIAVPTSTVMRGARLQVVAPVRLRRSAALGLSDDHVVAIRQVDQRIDPFGAGACADVVDEDYGAPWK
jgi:hypothetical protein